MLELFSICFAKNTIKGDDNMCNINFEEVKVTLHGDYRYAERIKNEPFINQQSYTAWAKIESELAEKYKLELIEDLRDSKFLCKGVFSKDEQVNNYFINKDKMIVFALDSSAKSVLTLFKVDYGFGDKVNRIAMNELLKEVEKLKKDKYKFIEKKEKEIDGMDRSARLIEEEIKLLESKIRVLETQKEITQTQIDNYHSTVSNYSEEILLKSKQITHSIGLRNGIEH